MEEAAVAGAVAVAMVACRERWKLQRQFLRGETTYWGLCDLHERDLLGGLV